MIYLICYLLLSAIVFISTLYFDAHYRHLTYDKIVDTDGTNEEYLVELVFGSIFSPFTIFICSFYAFGTFIIIPSIKYLSKKFYKE